MVNIDILQEFELFVLNSKVETFSICPICGELSIDGICSCVTIFKERYGK